jgi:hypothetical protein
VSTVRLLRVFQQFKKIALLPGVLTSASAISSTHAISFQMLDALALLSAAIR